MLFYIWSISLSFLSFSTWSHPTLRLVVLPLPPAIFPLVFLHWVTPTLRLVILAQFLYAKVLLLTWEQMSYAFGVSVGAVNKEWIEFIRPSDSGSTGAKK